MYLALACIYETDVRMRTCARERKRKPVYREKGRGVGGGHAQVHIARAHTHTQDEEQDYVNHEAGIMRSNDLQITGFA